MFLAIEGIDKSSKSTQSKLLVQNLQVAGYKVERMAFPDRVSETGKVIDAVLKGKLDLPKETVHLLFAANRWEKSSHIRSKLLAGYTIIADRYSHSGVAYSMAKGLSMSWCGNSEVVLPVPDRTFYLDIDPETASKRVCFSAETYENIEFQIKVKTAYEMIMQHANGIVTFDASGDVNELQQELYSKTIQILTEIGCDVN